ncbi:MAG: zf-TFIIB domain-containing protein, partial [Chloroflexi bacterium]|nr:zf-TFIIB domain-containing protein [Chloroflexota bacterium]
MICPVCKSAMLVVEHKKTELDYCPKCYGTWFDSGELDLFLESLNLPNGAQFLSDARNAADVTSAEKKRRCPICGQKMKKTTLGRPPGILTDVCRKGDGLWFDGGEVGQLIAGLAEKQTGKPEAPNQVASFLGEVFQQREQA